MSKNVLIVIRRPPYGTVFPGEAFLAGIALTSMGMVAEMVLVEDGVYGAIRGQQPEQLGLKSVEEAYKSSSQFDLKTYIHTESAEERGLSPERILDLEHINNAALQQKIKEADAIMTF